MTNMMPSPRIEDVSFWVDETIWGHRLYDEQLPWLSLLEFLGIYDYFYAQEPKQCLAEPLDETGMSQLVYQAHRRLHIRNILFNNPYLKITLEQANLSDEQKWHYWLVKMHNHAAVQYCLNGQEVKEFESLQENAFEDEPEKAKEICEFYYLKSRFDNFKDFAILVDYFRSTALETDTNKRWSSKYIFPFGKDCFFDDLKVESTKDQKQKEITIVSSSSDRRFFGRTGELLYLMLCRSGKAEQIRKGLNQLIFERKDNQWNQLIQILQPFTKDSLKSDSLVFKNKHSVTSKVSPPYLPQSNLKEYIELGDDWVNLFNCSMPNYDVLPHLARITGLHLVIYFLNRACSTLGYESSQMVVEILAPRKTIIRDLASQSYYKNNGLSQQAVKSYIATQLESSDWKEAVNNQNETQAIDFLVETFRWKIDKDCGSTPEAILQTFQEDVLKRHKQHLQKVHSIYCKEIGLASTRGSLRTRYTPTDELLETLVLATVPERMEFQSFLAHLYQKYGLIIGDKQAEQFIQKNQADKADFSSNAERLEERLLSIGLLQRLSDACAYVINPYTGKGKL
ncbi:hypothetical protein COW36_06945 [bacterium (Candidatus Blackallbacteria) CG17_big_fil_post_rev_8_21_14_2_50_48_46]|uniref:Uncharacterized protein n=1 Tax=bacterium (Candidatus Blackallbacteria) CG17_big_fil_post_rev_8_21_14_2_50_48_46 TaxID=2014261 RepID=A0A2M7G793_9BACT|nr:MAG: hypothetical protein COW64_05335 [bacterium (Candidatus Blackallbacteria) CG18_big_fil_WC_8_21_14_2_50_49_26]PIW17933.1 MAG: hypothetical protein COW36_06945 [bacterium (Candidatus Blackallbacteria) CG17_big_fil_post_rev_8_21_14_2_50_48_46]PIW45752.1 MAG: hypothetical protein COW20_19125 [bacterium (Candidatus Blackallbacteria) CG13_big_fil_rev_8_21_14_2_50_49_14]